MSSKVENTIKKYHKRNVRASKILKRISIIFSIIILSGVFFKYKLNIINIFLNGKSYKIKDTKISLKTDAESTLTEIDIANSKIIAKIKSEKSFPNADGSGDFFNLEGSILSKKNLPRLFTVKAEFASIDKESNLSVPNVTDIIDSELNSGKLIDITGNLKTGIFHAHYPEIHGHNKSYNYSISAESLVAKLLENRVYLTSNVYIHAINTKDIIETIGTADIGIIDYLAKTVILKSNVVMHHNGYIIKAKKAKLELFTSIDKKNSQEAFPSEIKHVDAEGDVVLYDDTKKVTSENATYDTSTNSIIFFTNVILEEGNRKVLAEKFIYNATTKESKVIQKRQNKSSILQDKQNNRIEFSISS